MEDNNTEKTKEIKIKKKPIIILIGIILVICATIFLIYESQYQTTDDAYIESHMVQVAPKAGGQIKSVYIDDNQKIKAGDLIAEIDERDYKVRFEQADAQYKKALLAQNVAKANLSAVNSEIELAKRDLERYKKLYATGAVSKQVLDNAQTRVDGIMAKQETANQNVMSQSDSKVADADIKALKALRDQAELNLSYTKIYAPQDGTVTNKKVEKGAYVQIGQPLFVLVPDEVWVVANFKENQVGKMKPGQEVTIKVDAYPHIKFKGRVDSIQKASGAKSSLFPPENAVGSFVKIVQRIPVKITFDKSYDLSQYNIVSGMSVIPKVKVK